MTWTPRLTVRPWIKGQLARVLGSHNVIHYDLFAVRDTAQRTWFVIEARQAGRRLFARSVYLWVGDKLIEASPPVDALKPLLWTKETHHIFRRVHRFLLDQCELFPGYIRKSILCHYVPVPDDEPFPANMINTYRYKDETAANAVRTSYVGKRNRTVRKSLPGIDQ